MDSVLWKAIDKNGNVFVQQEGDKYNNFTDLKKQQLICFSLFNKNNNCNYMINLKTGQFIFNGISFSPSIQNEQLDLDIICNHNLNYAKNLFWYNEMNCDFNMLSRSYSDSKCVNTFMGYSVLLNIPKIIDGKNGIISKARPMIKIQRNNNKVTFSNCITFKYLDESSNSYKTIEL